MRKTCSLGVVRIHRLSQLNAHMLLLCKVVPTTENIGTILENYHIALGIASIMLFLALNIGFKYLKVKIATEVENCIRMFSSQKECEIVGLMFKLIMFVI